MKNTKNSGKFSHTKIVMAGLLATKSLVRGTADILYHAKYPNQQARNKAVMAYLHSLGVPSVLIFDDFSNLFETVFPDNAPMPATFPINMDYDQDNCQYSVLIGDAAALDQTEGA